MTNIADPAILNDVMASIQEAVCSCLEDNSPAGPPPRCFISLTRPPDDCCDYLAVYLERMVPTIDFPQVSAGLDRCGEAQRMARLKLKLVRSCWPVLKDNPTNPFPPSAEIQSASEGLLIDLNVVWCCLSAILTGGDWIQIAGGGIRGKLESIEPDRPRGGCAGFTATFLVELDACC